MKAYFEQFGDLLKSLNGDNLVICGANTLIAHGLNFNRKPTDLDVAIYTPTDKQKELLSVLTLMRSNVNSSPESNTLKLEKNGLIVDLLIHRDDVPIPEGLLYYQHNGDYYRVQSIESCIAAKRKYNREKDWKDFSELKACNFNMT